VTELIFLTVTGCSKASRAEAAKAKVLEHCQWATGAAADASYPDRAGPRDPWYDPAAAPIAARPARRKQLGLPSPELSGQPRPPGAF
jgi:hypothetical protein